MSDNREKAKALEEAFNTDESFAAQFKQAVEARDVDATISLAASKGIVLAPEDFAPSIEGREIDEAELEAVAGGFSWSELYADLLCVAYLLVAA